MTDEEQELEGLRGVSAQASIAPDGGVMCVVLPATRLSIPSGIEVMDTVLCPRGQGGYITRLLLARQVPQKGNLNWQTVVLLGHTWHTWSWNNIPADQPWVKIFAEHARLLR